MKVDAALSTDLGSYGSASQGAEAAGFDGIASHEMAHDPFLPLVSAATATSRVDLITGIAVAFGRSPMTVAMTAADLQRLSGGRMILGLGTQVKSHITRRYSMPWSHPAARMREYIAALRAIWAAWNHRAPLEFEGKFYRHTLMTHAFDPGPSPFGDPKVFLAAVGPAMTRVAGEVADGLMLHGFTTPDYVREVTLPNLSAGLASAGRHRSEVEITLPGTAIIADNEHEREAKIARTRAQLGFYGSTPAYRSVLEFHGWGALGDELHRMSKVGDWANMGELINDEVLETFTVIATSPEAAAVETANRYADCIDRMQIAFDPDAPASSAQFVHAIRSVVSSS